MKKNHLVRSFLSSLVLFEIALIFFASSTNAQGLSGSLSPAQEQTPQEINERLKQLSRTIVNSSKESTIDDYRIGENDLLDISVFEAPEMNCTLRVSADGEISMQLLGPVKVAGLTPRELESLLQSLLRQTYMKDPHVGVFVKELQSHPVSVVGAVRQPGVFQIQDTKTVIEMLSMAQGLADDAGNSVLIMHGAGFAESSDPANLNPHQENGKISPATSELSINDDTDSLASANQKGIEEINLKDLMESQNSSLNVAVHPGDIVKVTRAGIVYVVGEVRKPGGFVLRSNENISLLQALALAEGLTLTSAQGGMRIIRTEQGTHKRLEIQVNLSKILTNKAADPILRAKDIVFVPNSTGKTLFYRGAEAALTSATGVAIYGRY